MISNKNIVPYVITANEHIGNLTSGLSRKGKTLIICDVILVSYLDGIQLYGGVALMLTYPCVFRVSFGGWEWGL